MDNRIYGMTKGQASPTTEPEWETAMTPSGASLVPLHPLFVALAAGANFIGRTSSSNVAHCTRMIVEAVRTPGFSFLQILSPCVTFRRDQREAWKGVFREHQQPETDDPRLVASHLMDDDGFNIGVFYRGSRSRYAPAPHQDLDPAALEMEFEA
jgi:2-oxoglutarate ferredoxin oxidoreductase subunit beta